MADFDELIKELNIPVKENRTISRAFIHRSYLNEAHEKVKSNERLEFLGDSILSFLVSSHLFQKYPKLPEGELTNLRSSVVKTHTLSLISQKLHLGRYLKMSHGEEEGGGRENTSILADTFEAFLGAVFLDTGLSSVEKILEGHLYNLIPVIYKEKTYKDAKSSFQEIVQEEMKISPLYKVTLETGPDHAKEFTVDVYVGRQDYGSGTGHSKQEAEQHAARQALEKWKKKKYNNFS